MECEIHPVETDIISFSGDVLGSIEEVILPVSLGDRPFVSMGSVKFLNMDLESPFNMILGRPSLNMFQAVISTYHCKIKFPINELVDVRSDRPGAGGLFHFWLGINQIDLARRIPDKEPRYDVIGRGKEKRPVVDPETKEHQHIFPTEELRAVEIDPKHPGQTVRIGSHLEEEPIQALVKFLRRNRDVFAWKPSDLLGINPKVAIHSLNIAQGIKPVKQKGATLARKRIESLRKR